MFIQTHTRTHTHAHVREGDEEDRDKVRVICRQVSESDLGKNTLRKHINSSLLRKENPQ